MLKVIELFGGIGACTQAMKRLGVEHKVVDYVEIDKYAVNSYNAMNDTNYEPQDIQEWDKDVKADFIMHGSPCQDFSVAGNGAGGDEGSGTRSSLMWHTVRIVEKIKPKYVLWENVKNVLSAKNKHNYDKYLQKMEDLGYHNYSQVLNAKDYGVPQNRERIFVLSCLDKIDYKFPEKQELTTRLKDILEDEVDAKYYISSDKVEKLVRQIVEKQGDKGLGALISQAIIGGEQKNQALKTDGICTCLTSSMGCGGGYVPLKAEMQQLVQLYGTEKEPNPQAGRVYSGEGISPCMDTCSGGNRMPKIMEVQQIGNIGNTGHGGENVYSGETISPCIKARDYKGPVKVVAVYPVLTPARLEKRQNGRRCKECDEPMFTLTGQDRHGVLICGGISTTTSGHANDQYPLPDVCRTLRASKFDNGVMLVLSANSRFLVSIRKLTTKECWRLMGFDDDVFALAEAANSNTQLYKQAGNSIVVDVLTEILRELKL